MELRTTVRNFVNEMTYHHISFDTHIRVIIDEALIPREHVPYEMFSLPSITPTEQRQRLNCLPYDYDPQASDELITLLDV